jgi:hypothetical protein
LVEFLEENSVWDVVELSATMSARVWSGLHATRATANNVPTKDFAITGSPFMPR